jgi:hypothetical protein
MAANENRSVINVGFGLSPFRMPPPLPPFMSTKIHNKTCFSRSLSLSLSLVLKFLTVSVGMNDTFDGKSSGWSGGLFQKL